MTAHDDDLLERGSWVGGEQAPVALSEAPRLRAFPGKALVLVIAVSVLAGAALSQTVTYVSERLAARRAAAREAAVAAAAQATPSTTMPYAHLVGRALGRTTLSGDDGTSATIPKDGPLVVNVWLQGCADCMGAFRAYRDLRASGALLGLPIMNVAYGRADSEWAKSYGVDEELVFDDGAYVVRPLGISTFTTLVFDAKGQIRFIDRPDREGYEHRVRTAVTMLVDTQ